MLKLVPISDDDFAAWLEQSIVGYAEEKVAAGNWPAEGAAERSRKEFDELLPAGKESPDNRIWSLHDPEIGANVGVLWLAVVGPAAQRKAFIYDFVVFEAYRRRGYGAQALRAIEPEVLALGVDRIGLHVFGHNHGARALYEQAGYEVTNVNMERRLGGAGA